MGYVIIRIEGLYVEKFINVCINKGINFIDIQRYSNHVLLKLSAQDFRNIRTPAKRTKCKVRILGKGGLVFLAKRYRKRKSFLLGCLVFVSIFLLLWSYIWDIEVLGYPTKREILDYLNNKNIKIGSLKYCVDVDKLEYDLMMNFRDISWVDIRLKGTRLVINLSRRARVPNIIDMDLPCDVVAKKDGIITKLLVKSGVSDVKVGDAVLAGDILISGIVLGEESSRDGAIHAIGEVTAKTTYEENEEVESVVINKVYTKRNCSEYSVHFCGYRLFRVKVGKGSGKYDEDKSFWKVKLMKDFVIPLEIEKCEKKYYQESQEVIDISLAKKQALSLARDKVLKRIPKDGSIVGQHVEYFEHHGKIFAHVVVYVHENIGEEKIIK